MPPGRFERAAVEDESGPCCMWTRAARTQESTRHRPTADVAMPENPPHRLPPQTDVRPWSVGVFPVLCPGQFTRRSARRPRRPGFNPPLRQGSSPPITTRTRAPTHILGTPARSQHPRLLLGGAWCGTRHFPLHSPPFTPARSPCGTEGSPPLGPRRVALHGDLKGTTICGPDAAVPSLALPPSGRAARETPYLRAGASWCLKAPSFASSYNTPA